jgi:phosphate transport system substrate-binding protein
VVRMRKSRILWSMVLVSMVVLLAAGCGQSDSSDGGSDQDQEPGSQTLSGSVQIAGSTSVQPLAEELASAFMAKNPEVRIDVAGGGSGAGIKAAQEGTADIGTSSRELKPEETGIEATVIAKDGIAVIVNPSNEVGGLTVEQVGKIYTGEITNWKEVNGKDAPITLVTREEGSGTRDAFQELAGIEIDNSKAIVQGSTGAVRTAVANDPNAIGYMSMGSVNEEVKAVKIEGVDPVEANVLNGTYKISRPFLFLTKSTPEGVVKAFIDFVLSDEGQKIVGEEFVALN